MIECFGCSREEKLFTLMPSAATGVTFTNYVTYTNQINPSTYHGFYNGGGVAVGDINNDGLPDLFFCGNQQPSKLYLNKGNFKFEDITAKAGINLQGLWCTGATFADINGDGFLDLYVCRSFDYQVGWRGNQLFINNGHLGFSEKAEAYKLENQGASIQAAFFDYDHDGDLDCYLLNNSNRPVGDRYDLIKDQRKRIDSLGGNKLYRNDGDHFTDVTTHAGIYSSKIGFGLGVTVADINKDGWDDIYISNDYFERDYLYINNHDGTFTESLEKYIREISLFSMGADVADINNDSYPEIFVTDMLPRDESRIKTKTSFENWNKYKANVDNGYYHQFLRNVLQLNRGPVYNDGDTAQYFFSEIGRFAGVEASDWSWGALIADLDNDGWKDIFVANGMYKDVTDQDFIQDLGEGKVQIRNMKQAMDSLSSTPLANYAFHNNHDLTFTNKAEEWGLDDPWFSNGSAYVDLDNDGDLDLVTNNINAEPFIYRNNCEKLFPQNKYLKVKLEGTVKNRFAFGAKVTVYHDHMLNYLEETPSRGFQSCVDYRLNFGLGNTNKIDSVKVEWPDGKETVLKSILPNQTLVLSEKNAHNKTEANKKPIKSIFSQSKNNYGLNFIHKENNYDDFDEQRLIYYMHSTEGPRMAEGDVNGDGLNDIYIGGAKGQSGVLFVQTKNGDFKKATEPAFEKDSLCEDRGCLFFDADGDKFPDLFVCSGGNEMNDTSDLYDRLYINDGKGNFKRSINALPSKKIYENSSCADAADIDGDGDLDLFVGIETTPDKYGYPCNGYILQNNGKGIFTDITNTVAHGLIKAGMIKDAKWFDYDKDGKPDLVVTGEYMPIKIFHNEECRLKDVTKECGLNNTQGWWNRIEICDVNNDGYADIIAGNYGLNSRIKATAQKPVTMYVNDFYRNGITEQVLCTYNGDTQYPMILRHDLVAVLPSLKKKYLRYKDYSEKTVQDIFTPEQLHSALQLNAYQLQSCILMNNKKGGFTIKPLPAEAQFSPVYGIAVNDFDNDGNKDILLGGNFYECKPDVGINDASYGTLLKGDGKGNFTSVSMPASNLCVKGAVRDIKIIKAGNKNLALFSLNNDALQVLGY